MRDFRGAVIKLNAFQYNPARKILRVYKKVTVEVVKGGPDQKNILKRPHKKTKPNGDFDNIYRSNFINYDSVQTTQIMALVDASTNVGENGEMLIIVYDSFYNDMLPFVEWKKQKGIPTTIVNRSIVSASNNATEITNYIQNYYNTHPSLCYVLLVGDFDQITSPMVGVDASDASYAKAAGSDNYPDILVGRFSAETNAHVQTQVERSISYERDTQAGASWYKAAVGLASAENSGSESDALHMDNIRNDLLGFTYTTVDRIYDPSALASSVTTALNQGRSVVNYCGHGSETYWWTTGFHTGDIANLANTGKLPCIVSVSCVNGAFHTGTCFAEAWLRSQNSSGQPIGAAAVYMSTNNQPWVIPMVAQDQEIRSTHCKIKNHFWRTLLQRLD